VIIHWDEGKPDLTLRVDDLMTLGKEEWEVYLKHYPAAEPVEDFEGRMKLYHLYVSNTLSDI
jgi:hypothetical protein